MRFSYARDWVFLNFRAERLQVARQSNDCRRGLNFEEEGMREEIERVSI